MSTTSILDIYNQALSASGAPGRISQINENSYEREVCERWYENTVRTVQEAAYWPACETIASLALLSERNFSAAWVTGDPLPQFKYKYALPQDYLRARYLSTYGTFKIAWSVDRRALQTNATPALLIYTRFSDIVTDWTPSQKMATVYGLAANIGTEITGKSRRVAENVQRANQILLEARTTAANSENRILESIPDFIAARGYVESALDTRYYYEHGALFLGGDGSAQ